METNLIVNQLSEHLNSDQIFSLIHEIIDDICGICDLKTDKYVPTVFTTELQFGDCIALFKRLLLQLIDIRTKHESLQQLPEDIQKLTLECIEVRRPELRKAIINETIAENNPVLKDFFWKLNVVLDSDKMSDLNEPLVNLDLSVTENNRNRIVSLELDRDELTHVIKTLEEAEQELRQSY
ncbi:COMM domain-containing protein 8-like [Oppia nitens]|uniref:COMM domain-containing protein 8-like n=1 Tax=Oppia nitens TaxID=1686743 RepID=UPI0023DAC7B8|nr:COMM domain-containing protein 8-like [Oppia nitens]